jgi:hypothetical protein
MICLYYKEIHLGNLTFDNNTQQFVYNSIEKNEQKAKEKYHMLEYYALFNSKNKKQTNLFDEFYEFEQSVYRDDIIELAGIKKDDSLFIKLQKLASLSLNDDYFHIKNK